MPVIKMECKKKAVVYKVCFYTDTNTIIYRFNSSIWGLYMIYYNHTEGLALSLKSRGQCWCMYLGVNQQW